MSGEPANRRPSLGAQALGVIAACMLLALLAAFAARFGWELAGRVMIKLTEREAQSFGLSGCIGEEFETDLLDLFRARYRIVRIEQHSPRFYFVERVGGFNERELAVAFNDIDFCLRVRKAGFRNLWTPFAEFYHRESATRGPEDTPEKVARFQGEVSYMRRTWGPLLDADPAYNRNLSLQHEDFSLAFPPR